MAVDSKHMYLNEAELFMMIPNCKKHGLYKKNISIVRIK